MFTVTRHHAGARARALVARGRDQSDTAELERIRVMNAAKTMIRVSPVVCSRYAWSVFLCSCDSLGFAVGRRLSYR
jgi:hypothetical protein